MPKTVDWYQQGAWQFNPELFEEKYWVDGISGCWLWLGARGPQGALMGAKYHNKPRMTQARRISWMLHHGDDITEREVRHTCHNKMCVNPDHMMLHTNRRIKNV